MEEIPVAERDHPTIVYAIYPNRTQEKELLRQLGIVRDLYNDLLKDCIADYMEGPEYPSVWTMDKTITQLRKASPDIASVNVFTLRDAPRRVHAAMESFINHSADTGELHLPRLKSASRYRSLAFDPRSFRFDGKHMIVNKKLRFRYRNRHIPKHGRPVTVRVIHRGTGRWYVHVTYETARVYRQETDLDRPATPEGYDLGLVDLITDTEGNKIGAPDFYAQEAREIARLQRRISEMGPGPAREKKERRLARIHQRIERRRKGFLNNVADIMVKGHSEIVIEDLDIRKMKERADNTRRRNIRYTEASWRELVTKVGRKAESAGVQLIRVAPAYTTRTCSGCGHVGEHLPLDRRTFSCVCCGLEMDRDQNAARNILGSGRGSLREYAERSG